MKNTKDLVSLHDELFEKFKEFEISENEAKNVVGGDGRWVWITQGNGRAISVWEKEDGSLWEKGSDGTFTEFNGGSGAPPHEEIRR